jgi:adenine C2-methylase RlmN of 23S rRNA A2503 and tRNA A37
VPTVYDLAPDTLAERLGAWGEPALRARQVWRQLWRRAATYEAMADIPGTLRERLAFDLPLGVEVLTERTADRGATRGGVGGREAVRLPTTTPQRLTNAVFMGMGEPIGGCLLPS